MLECRRSRRSSVPSLALEFLLEAEIERTGAVAVAIGTLDGMPLFGTGDFELSRVTAAGAAKLAGFAEHPLLESFAGMPFGLSVVELSEGERVLVTSIGRATLSPEVESGVARILS
jgi:hypothetical protein